MSMLSVVSRPRAGRRALCAATAVLSAISVVSVAGFTEARAQAQSWPVKPIRLVIPAGPGGAADVLTRTFADSVAAGLGTAINVENRPGASGIIGTEMVVRAPADGYTLLLSSNTLVITPSLYKVSYDVQRDLAPIGTVATSPNILLASAELRAKTLPEVVALARKTQGGLSYGSPMVGSAAHLMVELLGRLTGAEFVHIPFKSGAQATLETLAGRVPLTVAGVSNALPHLQSGKLVAIAMLGGERSRLMPDVPTPAEAGIKGMDLSLWFAMFAPAGTPGAVVTEVNRQLNATLKNPGIATRLEGLGFDPSPDTPARLAERMKRDEAVFAKVVRDASIKPD
jgi:tripartite-type tricarboxylate transporter receptor subunit TctC